MKQVKAKFYPDIEEKHEKIEVIEEEVNLVPLEGNQKKIESKGTDEKGDWILVDFILDEDNFIEYDSQSGKAKKVGEEQWDQIKEAEALEDTTQNLSSVEDVNVNSLKSSLLTSIRKIPQIFTTGKKKLTQSIESLF